MNTLTMLVTTERDNPQTAPLYLYYTLYAHLSTQFINCPSSHLSTSDLLP
jgi:hypothetical protein